MKEESAEHNEFSDALPYMDQFSQSSTEYIRAMEMALQLLQREVENLRQQKKSSARELPEHEEQGSAYDVTSLIQESTSAEEIIAILQANLHKRFAISDSNIFLMPAVHTFVPASAQELSRLDAHIQNLEEEGIIDWAFEERRAVVIPNIAGEPQLEDSHFLIVPLFLRGAAMGIFIALTSRSEEDVTEDELHLLTAVVEAAAAAIDNIRSAQEITRMNQRLTTLNRQMLQSSKMASIGELAGTIAQEIESPLQVLAANLQLLETGVGDPKRRIQIIKTQAGKIGEISKRLMEFAKTTPADNTPSSIDIAALVDEVLIFVGSQLQRDGIKIVREIEEPSPCALGNKAQIEQVLLTLILFARDMMQDGGTLTIAAFHNREDGVCITIADTGYGFSEQETQQLFSLDTPRFSRTKAGSGLSVARSIIRQHNGDISVSSQEGRGTTFKISLPLFSESNSAS